MAEFSYCANTDLPHALWKGTPNAKALSDATLTTFCDRGSARVAARVRLGGVTPPATASSTENMFLWSAAIGAALYDLAHSAFAELVVQMGVFPPKLEDIMAMADAYVLGQRAAAGTIIREKTLEVGKGQYWP
ncbi:MAG: hypothetical protein JW839_02150 [Candidatus Lokiarchaeota archaeon]|nr:hypothetical protein [Candidatus Lokiarchaeota archaeon]